MAKKSLSPEFPTLVREDQEWGTRLVLKPFPGDTNFMAMYIQADIEKPTEQRRLGSVKIRFTSVPTMMPFNLGQTRIWLAALEAVYNAAKTVEQSIRPKEKAPAKAGAKKVSKSR